MRIFLTGGTGYIGSAVLDSLLRAGHTVDVLVRNREKASTIEARGAHPILGDLTKPATYAAGADYPLRGRSLVLLCRPRQSQ